MSEQESKPLWGRDPDSDAFWIEQTRQRLAALTDSQLRALYMAVLATGGEQEFNEIHESNVSMEFGDVAPPAGIHCAEFELVIGCKKDHVQPLLTILKFAWEVCGE